MIPKFRAWDGGSLCRMYQPDEVMVGGGDIWIHDEDFDVGEWLVNNDLHLMQSTGLKDLNGVDIFEGDIVIDYQGTFFEVKRAEGDAGFFLYPYDPEDFMTFYPEIELTIIGNIYEDPGLMEV